VPRPDCPARLRPDGSLWVPRGISEKRKKRRIKNGHHGKRRFFVCAFLSMYSRRSQFMTGPQLRSYDVVIVGAGLAGLCLARQLLMNSQKKMLLLEKRYALPCQRHIVSEHTA